MKPNESESDDKGVQIIGPFEGEEGDQWYLAHGGDIWRPPWTY
jgi:hypothetical protein